MDGQVFDTIIVALVLKTVLSHIKVHPRREQVAALVV